MKHLPFYALYIWNRLKNIIKRRNIATVEPFRTRLQGGKLISLFIARADYVRFVCSNCDKRISARKSAFFFFFNRF